MMIREQEWLIVKGGAAQPPETIDGLQFARSSGELRGRLGPADLPRMIESGCVDPSLDYRLLGTVDSDLVARLRISARGELRMICQRCLGPVTVAVKIESDLRLAISRHEIESAVDEQDRVLAGKTMPVAGLVEDEALLALPMVPRHERCEAASDAADVPAPSPFAALGRLKH